MRLVIEFEREIGGGARHGTERVGDRAFKRRLDLVFDRCGASIIQFLPALIELRAGFSGIRPMFAAESKPCLLYTSPSPRDS